MFIGRHKAVLILADLRIAADFQDISTAGLSV